MKKILLVVLCICICATMFIGCQKEEEVITYTVTFIQSPPTHYTKTQTVTTKQYTDGSLIGSTAPEIESNYTIYYVFKGWYTEEGCANAWNIYKDEVRCDMTLYACFEVKE